MFMMVMVAATGATHDNHGCYVFDDRVKVAEKRSAPR